MMEQGLLNEIKDMYHSKHLNALNTVGYKELFSFLDQKISLEFAIEEIKKNSRRYAKRQLTWFTKTNEYTQFSNKDFDDIYQFILSELKK